MNLQLHDRIHGFFLKNIYDVKDYSGTLYEFEHEKTGARLCWMKTADLNKTFSISFKTLPENDTGVFHILEHCVLNGSDKYPVREPFVELLKSSLQTLLNAFTYADKTVYPVSSRNEKDFMNLLSVYMDAVFHPAIYKNPNIFYQEGWHYEIRKAEDDPVYKGVVFNEMKGAFSSMDEMIVDELNRMIFPDNCYRFISGGDPACITDLSYEEFIETHRKFYHPTNAYVLLDGDLDLDAVLAFINDEYFSHYEKEDISFAIPMQEMTPAETRTVRYEIAPEEDPAERTQICFAKLACRYDEIEKIIALNIMTSILAGSNESPFVSALLKEGLAEDAEFELFDTIQQPWTVLSIQNTEPDRLERIREVLKETSKRILAEGISRREIHALINRLEFAHREIHEPAGLFRIQNILKSYLYGGDPTIYLSYNELFDDLHKKAEEGYFEDLLREFIFDDEHMQTVIAVPDAELGTERTRQEKEKLQKARAAWDSEETYIELNRRLDEWQAQPDPQEVLDTLPKLSLEDVRPEPVWFEHTDTEIRGVPVLLYTDEDRGITYMNLYFSLAGITKERLPYLSFFVSLLTDLPTETRSVLDLQAEIRSDIGSLGISAETISKYKRTDVCSPFLIVTCSALTRNIEKATDLILDILLHTKFEKDTILPLLKQTNESIRQTLIASGHAIAMRRTAAQYCAASVFAEYTGGYEYALFLKDFEEHYDEKIDAFIDECGLYKEVLFSPARLTVSTYKGNEETVRQLIAKLPYTDAQRAVVHYEPMEKRNECILIPAAIAYTGMSNTLPYRPAYKAAAHILTYDWLWNEVRGKGGAYGTGCVIGNDGMTGIYSYRDPDPANSIEAARNAYTHIRQLCENDADITSFIIGTLAGMEPLLRPASRLRYGDSVYFADRTYEDLKQAKEELLHTKVSDMKDMAAELEKAYRDCSICVVASRDVLDSLKEMGLTELEHLS
ncbi:MAG: insulinase family protein [Solobacterium sp.]|nr:insulinase family protein [Solobacterium sp.]